MKPRIDIISGFLGAGKTTLILEMLKAVPEGTKLAVCENEYGEVGIDGDVLKAQDLEVVEINAGCVCCTLSFNLLAGIKLLVAQHHPTRILLEPTGLASLPEILNILHDEGLERVVDIGTAAVVIDGAAMLAGYERFETFYKNQIAAAQVIFLNRTGSLSEAQRLELAALIEAIGPAVTVVAEPFEAAGIWEALDGPIEASAALPGGLPKNWLKQFKHLFVDTGWPGSREQLERFIADQQALGEVVRAKGYVFDRDGRRLRVDFSGGQWSFEDAEAGGRDCLQFIGRNLSSNVIKHYFEQL